MAYRNEDECSDDCDGSAIHLQAIDRAPYCLFVPSSLDSRQMDHVRFRRFVKTGGKGKLRNQPLETMNGLIEGTQLGVGLIGRALVG